MKYMVPSAVLVLCMLIPFGAVAQELSITLGDVPPTSSVCGPLGTIEVTVTNTDTLPAAGVEVVLASEVGVNVLSISGDGTLGSDNTVAIGDLGIGESATFVASFQLSCAATSLTFEFEVSAESDTEQMGMETSESSERVAADISIPRASDPAVIEAFLGSVETLEIGVVNNGFGVLESLNYCVSGDLTALELTGLVIAGIDVGTTPDFTQGALSCFTVMLPAPFTRGQTVTVEETWETVACANNPSDIQRRAQYGCQMDNDCQDKPQGNFVATGVTFDALAPDFNVVTVAADRPDCYMDAPTTATVRLTNEGTSPGRNLGFRIQTAATNGMAIDESSVVITNDQTGAAVTAFTVTSRVSTAACQGPGLTLIDYRLADLILEPGQSITVSYSVNGTCGCNDCNIRNKYFSQVAIRDYDDLCGNRQTDRGSVTPNGRYDAFISGLAEGPTALNDGGQGTVSYFATSLDLDWMTSEFPDAYMEVLIDIPCALDYVDGSFVWVDRSNNVYPPASVSYVDNNTIGSTDQLIVRFDAADRPGVFNMTAGANFDFDVVADCDEKDLTDCDALVTTQTIAARFELTVDPTCTATCTTQKVWAPDDLPVSIRCTNDDDCEECDGIDFQSIDIFRTNLGLADANNDQVPDGTATADPATAQLDRYLPGDSIRVVLTGQVKDVDNDRDFRFGFVEFPLEHSDFTPLAASLVITDASDGTTYTCNAVPITPDAATMRILVDFSVDQLNAFGCGLPAGFSYDEGDDLVVTIDFTEKNILPEGTPFRVRNYDPRFYVSETGPMPTDGQCNPLNGRMTQVGLFTEAVQPVGNFGACDLPDWTIRYDRYIGGAGLDEFANEIRPIALPDRLVFTKPPEFGYRLDAWGLTLRQRISPANDIVNTNSIPPQFLFVSGDEVTFLIGDYLESLDNPEISPDEGFQVSVRPRIQGNCSSTEGGYTYNYQLFEEVDENIFCQPEIARPPVTRAFEYTGGAVLVVEAVTENIRLCSGSEDIQVRVRNVSSSNAVNSFFYPGPTGGVLVTRVEGANGAEILPNEFGIYPLGTVNRNSFRELTVSVTKNTCADANVEFIAGWDCLGLPTTINDAICADPSAVSLTSANSGVDMLVTRPASSANPIVNLCDPVTYEAEILSTDLGFVRDIELTFTLPPNVIYTPGTFELAVPSGVSEEGNYINPGVDPTPIGGNAFTINISALNTTLDTEGLIGAKDPANSAISIRFDASTACGFLSGGRTNFTIQSNNSCGDPLPPVVRRSGRVRTSTREQDIVITVSPVFVPLDACTPNVETLTIEANIGGEDVSAVDSIRVFLPAGVEYVSDTYVPVQNAEPGNNPTAIRDEDGNQVLLFPLTPPANGESIISFDIDITAVDIGQVCQMYPIQVDVFAAAMDDCNGEVCQVLESRGQGTSMVQIQKPDLEFEILDGTITLNPGDGTATSEFTITVVNNGFPLLAGNTVTIAMYEDVNGNGSFDPDLDVFLYDIVQTLTTDLSSGDMVVVTGTSTIPASEICTVIAVIDPDRTCSCTTRPSVTFRPEIIFEFQREYNVCSGEAIEVGPPPVAGYEFEWLSVDGSNLGFLNPTDDSPTTFTAPPNFTGGPLTVEYDVRVSNAPCFSDERVSIMIAPFLEETVDVQACAGGTFTLPSPQAEETSNFSWSPTTGLTISDDGRTATVDEVALDVTTYTLTYSVGDGCPASYIVNLTGLDCGTVQAALGDTVWFDFNENGLYDVDEPGVGGVTVFLINANNGSIISSAITAADGSYLFDELPAGNYSVQFVLPDGFAFTQSNQGADDTNDSDPDPVTGITPPLFVPLDSVDLNFDAGFIPDCTLELDVVIGPCLPSGDTLARALQITALWENNPYTYDQFGDGNDTLDLTIDGSVYTLVASELSDTVLIVDSLISPATTSTLVVDASFRESSACVATFTAPPIEPCIYDLALIKTASTLMPTPPPYTLGDVVCFDITVFNQGDQSVNNVQVFDSLPGGFTFSPIRSSLGWSDILPLQLFTFRQPIAPGGMATTTLCATITNTAGGEGNYINRAEINAFTDTLGNVLSDFDVDSQPDNNFSNDAGGEPGGATDDELNGNPNDPTLPNDEDDADPLVVPVFDLALLKTLAPVADQPTGRVSGFRIGDQLAFTVTVVNQGNQDGFSITVRDSVSEGLILVSSTVPGTTRNGNAVAETSPLAGGAATGTLTLDQLAAGDTVDILLIAEVTATAVPPIVNFAEISAADDDQDPGNGGATDVDSTPDDNLGNDPGGIPGGASDDATGGDGSGVVGDDDPATDEDDADGTLIPVYDLALIKTLDAASVSPTASYAPGTEITFNVEVCNQGSDPATNVVVKDYLPCGLGLRSPPRTRGGTSDSPLRRYAGRAARFRLFLPSRISWSRGSAKTLPIVVSLGNATAPDRCPSPPPADFLTNRAEIQQFEDVNGNVQIDLDSNPDGDPDNDPGGVVNSASDDQLDGNGTGAPGSDDPATDEDDADPASLDVFDLAIYKTVDTVASPPPYLFGDLVKYDIGIVGQGTIPAQSVTIADLSPIGLVYDPTFGDNATAGDGSGWQGGPGAPTLTITDFTGLIPGNPGSGTLGFLDTAFVSIWLQIEPTPTLADEDYTNFAQLESAVYTDAGGDPVEVTSDGDSPFDLGAGNDTGGGVGSDDDNETTDNLPGEDIDSQDPAFIMVSALSLGSTVFLDNNNDGIQNGSDAGLPGVEVQLFSVATGEQVLTDAMGVPVGDPGLAAPVLTDADGNYLFVNQPPGDYFVVLPAPPLTAPTSSNNSGIPFVETDPDDDTDGDDDGLQTEGRGGVVTSGTITLAVMGEPTFADGETAQGSEQDDELPLTDDNGNMTLDFGFFLPVTVGDTAFVDLDGDGLQSPADPGIGGVTVTLIDTDTGDTVLVDADGNAITGQLVTQSDGSYLFENLPPGDYTVLFDISTADDAPFYTFTDPDVGDDDGLDSDAVPIADSIATSGTTGFLNSGQSDLTLDVGVVCNISVTLSDPFTICSTQPVDLLFGVVIAPDTTAAFGATWTTPDGNGTFVDAAGAELTAPFRFGEAVRYLPSKADALRGAATFVLTTDDPAGPCLPVSNGVTIEILKVDCGAFFWDGQ